MTFTLSLAGLSNLNEDCPTWTRCVSGRRETWVNYDATIPTLSVTVKADDDGVNAIISHPLNRPENLQVAKSAVFEAYSQLSLLSPKLGISSHT